MASAAPDFPAGAARALGDGQLQAAMTSAMAGLVAKRSNARAALPEFDALRDSARDIKNHVLAHLDLYLERYEEKVVQSGGHVHWAASSEDAVGAVLGICEAAEARIVTKGKSMVAEEIGLNDSLAKAGHVPIETDLGEYLVQIRNEMPVHFILPVVHLNRGQVEEDFRRTHTDLDPARNLDTIPALVEEARSVLRKKYFAADVGITGANFLVAETGTSIIVTNEGNGDLTQILPRMHIVIASIEKIVPTLEDASTILRLLARSALGQDMTSYVTFTTGPRGAADPDGPEEYHVVILDNGRSDVLGTEFQDMLRCIRCGACLNHCPVYNAVGGHAYGSVYPGPIGSVVTPALVGIENAGHLPNASTLCGRCEEVCPMRIPLPRMLRNWREKEFERHLQPASMRWGLGMWAYVARHPKLYHAVTGLAARVLHNLGLDKGRLRRLPLASGWTVNRDLPAPQGRTFQQLWKERRS